MELSALTCSVSDDRNSRAPSSLVGMLDADKISFPNSLMLKIVGLKRSGRTYLIIKHA